MRLEELNEIKGQEVEKLAHVLVFEIETATNEAVHRSVESGETVPEDHEKYGEVLTIDELTIEERDALIVAAGRIYERLGFDPLYKYITVQDEDLEVADNGV